jgi:NADH-quinone oxidoreductase subunit M
VVQYYFFSNLLVYTINTLLFGTFFSYIIYIFSYKNQFQNIVKNDIIYNLIKLLLLLSLGVSYVLFILFFYFYYNYYSLISNFFIFNTYNIVPNVFVNFYFTWFEFSVDFFGIILLFLGYFVGILSLLALDNRIFWKNIKYLFSLNIFIIVVFFYVFSTNLLLFFLFYELLLIPSFLIVYYISPSRRAIQASLYFLIWTQIGSFLVLIMVAYLISVVGSSNFLDIKFYNFSYNESFLIYLFLFLGFGFKVPLWPFHYWLTKTHVEAPAGFSMYLSGFLVKSAVYGFYKITNLLGNDINTTLFSTICIIGVVDASLKMWGQTDLKKLVAYGTVQEMNLIFLAFCWGDTNAIIGGILFSATHGALSALMFYIVDCIQRRFNSRSVVEISGILQVTPLLGISIITMCVLYAGLPGTLKFTCEFYIFCGLFELTPTLTIILFFIANVLGLIGFSKCWFDATFGMNLKNHKLTPYDLNIKEMYIIWISISFLFIFTFISNYFF